MENNSELQISLRRNQSTLVAIGYGIIAFGVWSVLKSVFYMSINASGIMEESLNGKAERIAFWIMIVIMLGIEQGFRLYVGLSAVSEGKGRKKRHVYIGLAFLMALISLLLVVLGIYALPANESVGTTIVTIIVEVTSCTMLMEMAVSAIKVKRLSRRLQKEEG